MVIEETVQLTCMIQVMYANILSVPCRDAEFTMSKSRTAAITKSTNVFIVLNEIKISIDAMSWKEKRQIIQGIAMKYNVNI